MTLFCFRTIALIFKTFNPQTQVLIFSSDTSFLSIDPNNYIVMEVLKWDLWVLS